MATYHGLRLLAQAINDALNNNNIGIGRLTRKNSVSRAALAKSRVL